MSFKEIIDNVSNIEDLDNTTILKTLEKFSNAIKDFAEQQTGLQNLLNVEFEPNENALTYTNGVVDYLGNLKITLDDNIIVNKTCSIKFNIKGSETIIVDVDEFDNALEIHLDNSTITTLDFAESERQKSLTDGAILHNNELLNKAYPTGSIYLSVNDTSPASIFGGTWEKIEDRFLLSSGSTYSLGSMGGETQHTLTITEMPTHSHTQQTATRNDSSTTYSVEPEQYWAGWWTTHEGGSTRETGGSEPHNNMPPYLVVNMWKRVE